MADDAEIGRLRGVLDLENDGFLDALEEGREAMARFVTEMEKQIAAVAVKMHDIGVGLTAAITAPFAVLVTVSAHTAGAFEAAMNRVQAALGTARPEQLEQLADAAKALGPAVGRSAIEAAEGIEALALSGLNAEAILGGALEATLTLAAANNAELAPAAALTTDIMAQFAKTSRELPGIVDKVTGALDSSKFSFIDYQQAIAQAGGVAGSVGVSFDDFNTAIAATATQFASGSDAGTSFKSFLSSLNPKSKEAAYTMEVLGKRIGETGNLFFTAEGEMKKLADIADVLREALGGLSEKSRADALTNLFGADGMRTAIALMKQGSDGIKSVQDQIAKGSAAGKLATQMQGLEAANKRLAASWDALKIALGEAGIVAALTAVTNGIRSLVQSIAELQPWVLKAGLAIAGFTAAAGPLLLALVTVGRFALPLVARQFGLFGIAVSAMINPVGTVIALLGVAMVKACLQAAAAALGLGAAFTAAIGPIAIIVVGIGLLAAESTRAAKAEGVYAKALDESTKAKSEAEEAALALALATGKARKEAIENAKALLREKGALLEVARANLIAAKAAWIKAKGDAQLNQARMAVAAGDPRIAAGAGPQVTQHVLDQATANLKAAIQAGTELSVAVQKIAKDIKSAEASGAGTENVDFTPPDNARGKGDRSSGKTADEIQAEYQQELRRLRIEELNARLVLATDVGKRAKLQTEILREEYEGRAAEIRANKDFTDAQKAAQIEVLKKLYSNSEMQGSWEGGDWVASAGGFYNRAQAKEQAERQRAMTEDLLSRQADTLRAEADLINSRTGRLAIERQILNYVEKEARSKLEGQIAAGQIADAAKARALLERQLAANRSGVEKQYAGLMARYLDGIPKGLAGINDQLEEMAVKQLTRLEDGFAGIAEKVLGLHGALGEVLSDLLRIVAQQAILASKNGGGFSGFLSSVGQAFAGFTGGGSGGVTGAQASSWSTSSGLPGWASGGGGTIVGRRGVDANMLQINGVNAARVSHGEKIRVEPADGSGGGRGVVVNQNITLNAPGADPAALGRLQQEFRTMQAEMPRRVIEVIAEARVRRIA